MSTYFFYTLFYCLISGCIIYPPVEFVSTGLTIKTIFANWLGSETESFINYHIRRSVITLFIHSLLPFGYILGLILFGHVDAQKIQLFYQSPLWSILIIVTIAGPAYILYTIFKWSENNWKMHPIVQNLSIYCDDNTNWMSVASEIDIEYRRIDKILIDTSSVTRVIVTDNWIIKITSYKLYIARQNDTALIVSKSDTHAMSHTARGEVQFINIEVKPTRIRAEAFDIRISTFTFKDLQDKVQQPIVILQDVTFHKTLLDRFIDVFKEQALENPFYETTQELENCIGCMQVRSNVKLNKCCGSITERPNSDECTICHCRPMWCIECMAKWFASRQDENTPEIWLSSKCTCPVCRAKFCLLDVCPVQTVNQ
ncbi:E3 ubiquitin-protein ligase TM129 [Vespula maculifrons]|uniref:E3 ubiquitin-protein ligase TM129 n=1 Tax=Vespula maculifrons TaxID=7453 RepID=A0ABD2CMV3_VESMC